jgi:hypothetical protein
MNRRTFLTLAGSAFAAPAAPRWPETFRRKIAAYLEQHRRGDAGYGWSSDVTPQLTPTFAAVGCYRLLGMAVPDRDKVAAFVRTKYPVPEVRRKDRPLWRFDWEQVQTLLWLEEPIESFRELASTWIKPADFTKTYELGGNPVLQHQAMAVRVRHELKLPATEEWRAYFRERRRANGTFNTTPASDGSDGHLMNTLWGVLASECLGAKETAPAEWVRQCQTASGGFTYSPKPPMGGVDDLAYTWCALQMTRPAQPEKCGEWIESLFTPEGGFQDRPGGEPNPLATFYALDSLRLLDRTPKLTAKPAARAKWAAIPSGARVFSIQVEAPGNGSPREAALLAKTLGVHIWAAKNAPAGWIEEAQRVAGAEALFAIANEEYGTYTAVPGLGCNSHQVDTLAAAGVDSGQQLPKKNFAYPWPEFRDTRIAALRRGRGRMVWQFNENEELTRACLDEAVEQGTYGAIASFHFGNECFLHSQPFLHRWYGRIPFVGLQDAHGGESWWWGNQLAGFTTLFVAREATWDAWLEALERNLVMSVRHDAISGWKTELAGGSPALRDFVMKREREWRWWDDAGKSSRRPVGALVLLRPGMKFEVGAPAGGLALRLRLWAENTTQGLPREARTELVALRVDGRVVRPELRESREDRYFLFEFADAPGAHRAEAEVRVLESGRVVRLATEWRGA